MSTRPSSSIMEMTNSSRVTVAFFPPPPLETAEAVEAEAARAGSVGLLMLVLALPLLRVGCVGISAVCPMCV